MKKDHEEKAATNAGEDLFRDKCTPDAKDDEILRLKAEISDWQDKYLRVLADAENEKRRVALDAQSSIDARITDFALAMLPLSDNIKIALGSVKDEAVKEGLEGILAAFESALEKQGIRKIKTVGQTFDPKLHHAVAQVESAGHESGAVAEELAAGYMLDDNKILREALVATAK